MYHRRVNHAREPETHCVHQGQRRRRPRGRVVPVRPAAALGDPGNRPPDPGASIIDEIVDLNVSGGSMQRVSVQGPIDRVDRGEADGIVVAYPDRWARTIEALEMFGR